MLATGTFQQQRPQTRSHCEPQSVPQLAKVLQEWVKQTVGGPRKTCMKELEQRQEARALKSQTEGTGES